MDGEQTGRSTYWLAIPQQNGWGLISDVNDKKIGLLFSTDMKGSTLLKIVGYHTGETKWIGEQKNILAIKIEKIPENNRNRILPQIRKSLVRELRDVDLVFLDDRYVR